MNVPSPLQVSELYCSACERPLCEDCVSDHNEHPQVPLSRAVEQHRGALQARLGAVQNRYRRPESSWSCTA